MSGHQAIGRPEALRTNKTAFVTFKMASVKQQLNRNGNIVLIAVIWPQFLAIRHNQLTTVCASTNFSLQDQNLGWVFNSRTDCMCYVRLCCYETKSPNLKLKSQPRKPLGYLPLTLRLPGLWHFSWNSQTLLVLRSVENWPLSYH